MKDSNAISPTPPSTPPTPPSTPPTKGTTAAFIRVLQDGRTATIKAGVGRDAIAATRLCDGDQSMWLPALLSILGRIDGEALFMEDWIELPLKDYMALASELGGNFI